MAKKGGNPQNLKKATPEILAMAHEANRRKGEARRKLLAAMQDNVSEDELDTIIAKQKEQAMSGDRDSATWVVDRLLGKAPTAIVTQDENGENMPIAITLTTAPLQPDNE